MNICNCIYLVVRNAVETDYLGDNRNILTLQPWSHSVDGNYKNKHWMGNKLDNTRERNQGAGFILLHVRFYMKFLAIALLFILTTCKQEEISVNGPGVYVAGSFTGTNVGQAVYWKNQQMVVWSPDKARNSGELIDLFVKGSDIYAAGFEMMPATGWLVAKYWKNGIGKNLTDGSHYAAAFSITVSGEDVYVCGQEVNSSSISVAKYWKNGVGVSLTDGTNDAIANTIIVSGSDIYISGQDGNKAVYWKNGIAINLPADNQLAGTSSMVIQGADIYISGFQWKGYNTLAVFWKNGQLTALTDGTKSAGTSSIFVSGTGVYVAGYEVTTPLGGGGHSRATYWKNGEAVRLAENSTETNARSIVVDGPDIYVSGTERNKQFLNAKYWKNGTGIQLADPSKYTSANHLLIVK